MALEQLPPPSDPDLSVRCRTERLERGRGDGDAAGAERLGVAHSRQVRFGSAITVAQISATDMLRHARRTDFDPTGDGTEPVEDRAAIIGWLHIQRASGASISVTSEAVRLLAVADLLGEGLAALPGGWSSPGQYRVAIRNIGRPGVALR